MKCKLCGKEVDTPIEFDDDEFDIYCPDCGMKQVKAELLKIYPLGEKK